MYTNCGSTILMLVLCVCVCVSVCLSVPCEISGMECHIAVLLLLA